jgi:hypothetical protein
LQGWDKSSPGIGVERCALDASPIAACVPVRFVVFLSNEINYLEENVLRSAKYQGPLIPRNAAAPRYVAAWFGS